MLDRLSRVTDLFVEGTELYLGDDPSGTPVLVWVNKLNSLQAAEAQRDAIARRYVAIANLKDSGEYAGMQAEVEMVDPSRLIKDYVDLQITEIYLDAMNDLDLDAELRSEREAAERLPELLDDADTPPESPDRKAVETFQENWLARFQKAQADKRAEREREAAALPVEELKSSFLERWRETRTRDEFERELRTTQLFYALRTCEGKQQEVGWDHRSCDHSRRLLDDRKRLIELPDELIARATATLEQLTVPARAAGNSDAPTTSSESSER